MEKKADSGKLKNALELLLSGIEYVNDKQFPVPTSPARSRIMRANRSKDSRPEVALRKALWHAGRRGYRLHYKNVSGRPDITFVKSRVAVFVDGDFWHGRNLAERLSKLSKGHNAPYWVAKIRTNAERDLRHDHLLAEEGWLVLRFWETDILRDSMAAATEIATAVMSRLRGWT